MLELKKAEYTPQLAEFCKEAGILCGAECDWFVATCGGVVGCCGFVVEGEVLTVHALAAEPTFGAALCDGLVRAVYHHALGRGAVTALFVPELPETTWNSLAVFGYTHKTNNDIDNFLTNCKNCAHKG